MSLREYEAQWASIMEDNMFSEPATITDYEAISFSVSGVFLSGTYDEESAAAYAPKKLVNREFFQIPAGAVPESIEDPWKALEGFHLILTDRNLKFRIYEVAGKRSGTLTLSLQEVQDE